ncbi:unnamed protein product [Dovyalis caffra]|uniref:Uncharacterized protein n=1 Tax=Dovyalis caffra TaxID=77055 RepID=A0AAV1SNW8_9ROSI|nr:unnamed protein product [Dovyalis caffra]
MIKRRNLHLKNIDMLSQASLELQFDGAVYAMLNKEIAEKNPRTMAHEGRRSARIERGRITEIGKINGRKPMSRLGRKGLCSFGDKIINEIEALKTKEELIEENQQMKQQVMNLSAGKGHLLEQGQSSDSMVTNISSMSSVDLRQDSDSSCAFLTLSPLRGQNHDLRRRGKRRVSAMPISLLRNA